MAAKPPPSTIAQVKDVFTKLGEISDKVVFGDVWERKQLSKRDRSLITIAALTALYRPDQLRGHLHRAFDNGVTREEIIEGYAAQSGRDLSNIRYYETFALFKLAVVIQQIYYRYRRGQTDDARFANFGDRVLFLAREAAVQAGL